jgi:virginiamycin B lyase
MAPRTSRRFRPSIESLEDRQLLAAAITGAIAEFPVPTNGRPAYIARGPQGDNELWFTDQQNARIGRINSQGIFDTSYPVPTPYASLGDITAGPDGNMWFLENTVHQIGRVTPDGQITEFPVNTGGMSLTHIVSGPDGALWFTGIEVSGQATVGRITTDGHVTTFQLPGAENFHSPSGITVGPDNALWMTEPYGNEIVRMTTTGQVHEFTTGISPGAFPVNITTGPDGNLWFTEPGINSVGRITPQGSVTEFTVGIQPNAALDAITTGPDGALWFTEDGNHIANRIGRITTDGTVSEYAIPSYDHSDLSITAGTDGNVWFTENGAGNIGKVDLVDFEARLAFSASSYSVNENAGTMTVIVNRGGDTSGTVSVHFATGGGTALAGVDYTETSGTLTFGPGVTSQAFTIPILNAGRTSGSEMLNLTLSGATGGAALGTPSTAVLTIFDTAAQPGQLGFSAPAYTVSESGGVAYLTVTRTGGSDGTVSVPYMVGNGTAVNGVDYLAASGTLTFNPGETAKVIAVTILDRGLTSGSTSLTVTLGSPTGGATLASPSQAALVILDNDSVPPPPQPPISVPVLVPVAGPVGSSHGHHGHHGHHGGRHRR